MKRLMILFFMLISMAGLTACATDNPNSSDKSVQDRPEKMYEDIAADSFKKVNISGNAKSIVIRRSESENFEFYNGDLNTAHIYTVRCDQRGEILNIEIIMESLEEDNDVLGSPIIDIPQKEFEKIEVTGDFSQVSLYAVNSNVLIHASNSFVYLDLEADRLKHNVTLDGSESNAFRGVSIYFDKFPDNISMDLNLIQGGTINDPQDILKANGLESGSRKPVISINNAKEINIYSEEGAAAPEAVVETKAVTDDGNVASSTEEIGEGDPIVAMVDRYEDNIIVLRDLDDEDIIYYFSTQDAQVVEGDSSIASGDIVEVTYKGVQGDEKHPGMAVKVVAESMMYK